MSMVFAPPRCASNLAIARQDRLQFKRARQIPQIDCLQRGCGAPAEKAAVVVDVPQLLLYPVLVVGENFNEQVEHVDSFTATVPSRASPDYSAALRASGPS